MPQGNSTWQGAGPHEVRGPKFRGAQSPCGISSSHSQQMRPRARVLQVRRGGGWEGPGVEPTVEMPPGALESAENKMGG